MSKRRALLISVLALPLLLVLEVTAAQAIPLTVLLADNVLPPQILDLPHPGQLYLTLGDEAHFFADLERNTPISEGRITPVPNLTALLLDDLLLASGPWTANRLDGRVTVTALLTPQGGFLSSPLLAEISLPGLALPTPSDVRITPVPEPASVGSLAAGLALLTGLRRWLRRPRAI